MLITFWQKKQRYSIKQKQTTMYCGAQNVPLGAGSSVNRRAKAPQREHAYHFNWMKIYAARERASKAKHRSGKHLRLYPIGRWKTLWSWVFGWSIEGRCTPSKRWMPSVVHKFLRDEMYFIKRIDCFMQNNNTGSQGRVPRVNSLDLIPLCVAFA